MIRLATPGDARQIAAIYAPYVTDMPTSFELVPPDESEMQSRITKILRQNPWLVYMDDGDVLGYVYASPHGERAAYRWSVDVTVYIHKNQRRRGIGKALYYSLFAILRAQGYITAFAGVSLPNDSSVGLHEAMGFTPVGIYRNTGFKFGKWHDVGWWQMPLGKYTDNPTEPIGVEEVQTMVGWEKMLMSGMVFIRPKAT
jgi:L-amino acid N-acyltransferase YncA